MQSRDDKIVKMPIDHNAALRISVAHLEKEAEILQSNFEIYKSGFDAGEREYRQAFERERCARKTLTWIAVIMTAVAILGAII